MIAKKVNSDTTSRGGLLLCFLLFAIIRISAQGDYDKQIAFGNSSMLYFTETSTIPKVDLKNPLAMGNTGASMADSMGTFQFCFNGRYVGSHAGYVIEADMNEPIFNQRYPIDAPMPQAAIALPKKGNTYWLFHTSQSDSAYNNNYNPELDLLYSAVVDMDANHGNGAVTSKKNIVLRSDFDIYGLTAVKHANGKDWWLIAKRKKQFGFYVFLVTPDTVTLHSYQLIDGGIANTWAQGKAVFNQQGNLFAFSSASGDGKTPLKLAKFDRCTGQFTLWKTLKLAYDYLTGKTINFYLAPAFSPSGRYLYTTDPIYLCQFDLFSADIDSSRVILDTTTIIGTSDSLLNKATLLYDGKIYIDNWAGISSKFSVINQPDSPGIKCDYHFHSIPVQYDSGQYGIAFGIPNLPNFRLGAVPSTDNQQNQTIYYCAGDSITLSRKHYPYSSYKWHDGSSTLATDTLHYALRPIGNKTIYVALHDSTCSCGNRTDTIRFIAVNDTAIYHSYHTTICSTDSIIIGNSYPNSRYAWYRDSTLISTADSITATTAATYTQHIVDTTLLCVTHIDTFFIDTIDCDTILHIPIGIHFFPNPANDYIEYTINDSTLNINELQLTIVAVSGAAVIQKTITNPTGKIDITNLASGVYILSLTSDKQVKYRKKWVVW